MKIVKSFIAILALCASFTASAWYSMPKDQADVDQKAWLVAQYDTPTMDYFVWFFEQGEGLVKSFAYLSPGGAGGDVYYWYSDYTKIGYTTTYDQYYLKHHFICPTGQTDKIKRHINIAKTWVTFVGQVYDTKPACPTAPTQPKPNLNTSTVTNTTTVAQIQTLYPNYTVTRLFSTRDIFKVSRLVSVYDGGAGGYVDVEHVYYLSDTQRIGYKYAVVNMPEVYVRTQDTVNTQKAKDDIQMLVYDQLGGYVVWVNYFSNPVYISWFN